MIYTYARHPTTAETILQPAALRPANIILRPTNKFPSAEISPTLKRQPNTSFSKVNLILYRNDSRNLYI